MDCPVTVPHQAGTRLPPEWHLIVGTAPLPYRRISAAEAARTWCRAILGQAMPA